MITGPLFLKIRDCDKRIIILQGGGDSGKTTATLQSFAIFAIEDKGSINTVTAQDLPNLKGGALRTFKKYVASDPEISAHIRNFNISESTYHFKNGSIIEFKAFTDEADARGSERDRLFINEANGISYDMFWQLQRKTRKKIILDYNPTSAYWCHSKLIGGEERQFEGKYQLYVTDHRHNPFLSPEEHLAYELISDPDMFEVYARGKTGKIKGLIFGHFKQCDQIPNDVERIIYGIDYGYTNDETALVKVGIKGRERYIKELCYAPGISADTLRDVLKANEYNGEPIYSEADPHMVAQLRRLGLQVFGAKKGPGSLAASISKVREYDCFYTADSVNFYKEINTWKWVTAQDLQTGKEVMTNVPVDGWDHACAATRYAIYTDSFRR